MGKSVAPPSTITGKLPGKAPSSFDIIKVYERFTSLSGDFYCKTDFYGIFSIASGLKCDFLPAPE